MFLSLYLSLCLFFSLHTPVSVALSACVGTWQDHATILPRLECLLPTSSGAPLSLVRSDHAHQQSRHHTHPHRPTAISRQHINTLKSNQSTCTESNKILYIECWGGQHNGRAPLIMRERIAVVSLTLGRRALQAIRKMCWKRNDDWSYFSPFKL